MEKPVTHSQSLIYSWASLTSSAACRLASVSAGKSIHCGIAETQLFVGCPSERPRRVQTLSEQWEAGGEPGAEWGWPRRAVPNFQSPYLLASLPCYQWVSGSFPGDRLFLKTLQQPASHLLVHLLLFFSPLGYWEGCWCADTMPGPVNSCWRQVWVTHCQWAGTIPQKIQTPHFYPRHNCYGTSAGCRHERWTALGWSGHCHVKTPNLEMKQ